MGLNMYIRAEDIHFSYDGKVVLKGVTLSFGRGEVVSLLGPNGCGKTTLLKVLLGILRPEQGKVLFEGRPIDELGSRRLAQRVAYVPQMHRGAFPYSVLDVVLMGRMPHKGFFSRYTCRDRQIAEAMLEKLGIEDLRHKPYTQVSGGERQLVLIARALAQGADTFVMDEPTTGLDYGNQIRLLEQVVRLSEEGNTFIQSTHFPDHALWVSDRVVLMKNGSVAADGAAAEEINAENLYDLYRIPVRVLDAGRGFSVCIPSSPGWECSCRKRRKHDGILNRAVPRAFPCGSRQATGPGLPAGEKH